MSRLAIVSLLPEALPGRLDFVSRELDTPEDVAQAIKDLEAQIPNWRVISICHVEDLPLLMEPSDYLKEPGSAVD